MTDAAPSGPSIPLFDLARQHRPLAAEARALFERVAASGQFVLGEELAAFETEFAAYCGVRHCVGVASGTDALVLALRAAGVGPGDEVVTVPYTFVATVEAIALVGATPVLVDIDPATRCLDPQRLEEAFTERTAAVVPVHLYGRPAPMDDIVALCAGRGIRVVDDAAQAHGATLDGKRAGAWGTATTFSFYPTKNLGALGDGGAVVSDDDGVAATVRSLRHHGSAPDDANRHDAVGYASRLDEVQAGILRLKLARLDDWNRERREVAERYRAALDGLPVELPAPDASASVQVYHLFVVEVDRRDAVLAELNASGIGAKVHYPVPVHLQPGWTGLGHEAGDFPHAERAAARCLSLPIFPGITEDEVERVAEALRRAIEHGDRP